ncbi:transcription factor bHLH107 [Canna indica]|uniref:Transcription factor bHLH107 n=1 Tax=Canna indica TaxID=4628 RepID=A0AAQ3KYR8_9LILI|nr:transcription factor bHLH107 [Canna indica]
MMNNIDHQEEMLTNYCSLPSYFMASFYPAHMEMEMEMIGGGEASCDAAAATPVDRSLLASRNHRDAERRRRERIKSHLDRLRTILACDPKIDKASLLAKVVERVKDLKQQAEDIAVNDTTSAHFFPTETDEIIVLPSSGDGRPALEASLCCEDRSTLLPELIETLQSLRLKTLRAEIATLGGRVRNVLILSKDEEGGAFGEADACGDDEGSSAAFLRDALKALVERPHPAEHCKRRRLLIDQNNTS